MFKQIISASWKAVKYYSIFHVVTEYIIPVRFYICRGSSMQPTLNNNDIILTENFSVRYEEIRK